jgi:hypothetical protein
MFKVIAAALLIGLLAACAGMPGSYASDSMGASDSASASPPRSPGEGPSFTPYGAAGF